MSDGWSFLLAAEGLVDVGLYLPICMGDWCGRRWNVRSDRLAVQHGKSVANRLKAQFSKSTDTRRPTGQTRLGRRGTPDTATAETAIRTVLNTLGLNTESTTTIPAIREPHPETARGAVRTPDLASAAGTYLPASRNGFDRERRAGTRGVPILSPRDRDAAHSPARGGERPTTWAASA